jgi:hypothetical protein
MSTHPVLCDKNSWTDIYNGPAFGVLTFSADIPVQVQWRAYAFSLTPPYTAGIEYINGQKQVLVTFPTPFVHVEVKPAVTATILVS